MCLTTKDPTVHVAEKDIIVFKRLDVFESRNKKRSFFQRLFGLNKTVKRYCPTYSSSLEYKLNEKNPEMCIIPRQYGEYYEVESGYHSDVVHSPSYHNATFVIPKGTRYIKGWYNDEEERENYVSEQIIFVEILDRK